MQTLQARFDARFDSLEKARADRKAHDTKTEETLGGLESGSADLQKTLETMGSSLGSQLDGLPQKLAGYKGMDGQKGPRVDSSTAKPDRWASGRDLLNTVLAEIKISGDSTAPVAQVFARLALVLMGAEEGGYKRMREFFEDGSVGKGYCLHGVVTRGLVDDVSSGKCVCPEDLLRSDGCLSIWYLDGGWGSVAFHFGESGLQEKSQSISQSQPTNQ